MNKQIGKDRVAVLVDGDNANPSLLDDVLLEAAKHGRITIKRIYGDWTTPNMNGWKNSLHDLSMQPIQQFRYTTGKNATDNTMIIDAVDILHRRLVNGFCIVSTDSDFTRLAIRIREDGLFVIGIGKRETPNSFVKACDEFVYTENLKPGPSLIKEPIAPPQPAAKSSTKPANNLPPLFKKAFAKITTNDGWVDLAVFGSTLRQLEPGFAPSKYGYGRLSVMLNEYSNMIEQRRSKDKFPLNVYVRLKSK